LESPPQEEDEKERDIDPFGSRLKNRLSFVENHPPFLKGVI